MQKLKVDVVFYDREKWFEFAGLKFDTLSAADELDRQELTVWQSGKVIGRARVSESRGEPAFHDFCPGEVRLFGSALRAENFAEGDYLEINAPDDFNLAQELWRDYCFQTGMVAAVAVGQQVSVDAMWSLVNQSFDEARAAAAEPKILRFRRG